MNHVESLKTKVLEGCPHRSSHSGRHGALELEAQPPAAAHDQQVELGAGVRRPEEALLWPGAEAVDDRVQRKAFPRRAAGGVSLDIPLCRQAQEGVEKARVTHIDLRGLDLGLPRFSLQGRRIWATNADATAGA